MKTIAMLFALCGCLHAEMLEMGFKGGVMTDVSVTTYRSVDGDSLYGLSQKFYGNPQLWPVIFFDNIGKAVGNDYYYGHKLLSPEVLPAGIDLSIRNGIGEIKKSDVYAWLKEYYAPDGLSAYMNGLVKMDYALADAQKEMAIAIREEEERKKREKN